jgi:gamma-glutamylcyclotransferase (GGCT)/AIG2-like uncharacterized protein YtfP
VTDSETPETRLATYGSLAPGRLNHNQLAQLTGRWVRGTVNGRLMESGWGAAVGFPGLVLDPAGPDIEVHVFESIDLPDHWHRLDKFEGPDYRRVVAQVHTADGELKAWIYALAE